MTSIRARLVKLALPLLGIKRFFSQPDKFDERIAKPVSYTPLTLPTTPYLYTSVLPVSLLY